MKSESRMTKPKTTQNNEALNLMRDRAAFWHSGFELPSIFVIQISSLANVISGLARICNP
jgi:hypothetical protein